MNSWKKIWNLKWRHSRLPPRFINNLKYKRHGQNITPTKKYLYLSLFFFVCLLNFFLSCSVWFFSNADTIYVSFKYNNNKHMMKKTIFSPSKKSNFFIYFLGAQKTKKNWEEIFFCEQTTELHKKKEQKKKYNRKKVSRSGKMLNQQQTNNKNSIIKWKIEWKKSDLFIFFCCILCNTAFE